jgi:hypothetical protein
MAKDYVAVYRSLLERVSVLLAKELNGNGTRGVRGRRAPEAVEQFGIAPTDI